MKRAIPILLLLAAASYAGDIHVKDFGAVGDGKTDDGPAIRKALAAAWEVAEKAKDRTVLKFEKKVYRLGRHTGQAHMVLDKMHNLTIDGAGATLLCHPSSGVIFVTRCQKMKIGGFTIDFSPLPFTQGTIRAVDAKAGTFDLQIQENYPLPPADRAVKKYFGESGWQWGTVMDPKKRHRRWDVADHFFIEQVTPVKDRTVRIKVTPAYARRLTPVRPNDRFFLPLMLVEGNVRAKGTNFLLKDSYDSFFRDITIHTARSGMNFAIVGNSGFLSFKGIKIMFKKGSTHLCTSWKDGMHVKDNRNGPEISNCYFEGMLDDSINMSANTAMAEEIISDRKFKLKGARFDAGDKVLIFDPVSGKIVAETKVTHSGRTVWLADEIPGVVTGHKRPQLDIKATHFYNLDRSNENFVITNCVFKPQRRHAMLIRSFGGVIEKNTIEGVGGAAIWMGNEMGNFYEGPFPHSNTICNNRIRNCQRTAIRIYTRAPGDNRHTNGISLENNEITVLPGKLAISAHKVDHLTLRENKIMDQDGNQLGKKAIELRNCTRVHHLNFK